MSENYYLGRDGRRESTPPTIVYARQKLLSAESEER